ncbi:N-acetyltransferase GCN5 [Klebsiella pneumoniae]|uniref:N-acetyltransferase GCN5 n=1 Tax=Klebsiella pneumoniae TaxID=573 RepID=A0A2X1QAU9_KLEPN|nr:N-acetyltransferase GCN5 [Klebsiella pneumoniae]
MNPGIGKTSKQKYWGEAAPDASLSGGSAIIDGRTIQPGASVLRCTPENVSPADSGAPPCPQRPRYSTSDLEIREALPDDAHAIAALYVWHVLNGRASFEEIPPTVDEMRKRIQTVRDNGLPWLVALWRGAIVGYCYATFYRPRPAYRYTLEESIYVESGMGGRGIGSALLSRLIAECEKGPWRQMLAIIGDGHNNAGSLAIHKKFGFTVAGQLRSVGYKMGDWRDTLIMQRALGDGDWTLPE